MLGVGEVRSFVVGVLLLCDAVIEYIVIVCYLVISNCSSVFDITQKLQERYEKSLPVSSSVKGKPLPTPPSGIEWATSQMANVRDRMDPGIRILPLPSANSLPGGRMSGQRSRKLLVLRMGHYP